MKKNNISKAREILKQLRGDNIPQGKNYDAVVKIFRLLGTNPVGIIDTDYNEMQDFIDNDTQSDNIAIKESAI